MPSGFHTSNDGHHARERFYHLPAPADPVRDAAKAGRGHYNAATGRTLYHQSPMPMGEHTGKDMERVPAKYLLYLDKKPWFATATNGWEHVRDYIARHREEIEERARTELDAATFNPIPQEGFMPVPSTTPPALPWPAEARMALHRDLGFTCGPFSIMATTGVDYNTLHQVLKNLPTPFRGWMNPTQMRDTLRGLNVPFNLVQKPTHEFIGGSAYRWCLARVQWEGPAAADHGPFGGNFAGWRNINESYKHTHYVAHHDGWVLCTALEPTQWITATEWAEKLRADGEKWHLTHRWFVKPRA